MSPRSLLAILVAPACGQLILQLGPVDADEDTHSNFESVALPGGFTSFKMIKRMPVRLSRPQSPIEQMVSEVMNGGMNHEEDEVSPEQLMQSIMLNGLQPGNLLRRSRLGFARPSQDDMFQKLWSGSFDSDDMFSQPGVSSSRTHTISDGDGVVRIQQTQCRDGMCFTRKTSQQSVNPFAKMKALRAPPPPPPQDDQYVPVYTAKDEQHAYDGQFQKLYAAPEVIAKEPASPKAEEHVKAAAPETEKKSIFANKDLTEFANMLEKGLKTAAAQSSKAADTVKEGLKQGIAAVADKFKEEHVMEV